MTVLIQKQVKMQGSERPKKALKTKNHKICKKSKIKFLILNIFLAYSVIFQASHKIYVNAIKSKPRL